MPLAPEQESKKLETIAAVTSAMEDKVAAVLKENYELLEAGFKLSRSAIPSDDDFRRAAREAIDKRSVTFPGQDGKPVTISIDQLDSKIKGDARAFITDRGVDHLSKLLPTRDQIKTIAEETGQGVAENLSNSGSATWGGLFSGLARTGISGLSGSGTAGVVANLQGNIAGAVAENMRASVETRLKALAESNPDIKVLIGDGTKPEDAIHQIGLGVQQSATQAGTGQTMTKPDLLAETQMKDYSETIRAAMKPEIAEQVEEKTRQGINVEIEKRFKEMRDGKARGGGLIGMLIGWLVKIAEHLPGGARQLAETFGMSPSKEQVRVAAETTASAVSAAMTSPEMDKLRREHPDQVAAMVTSKVQAALEGQHTQFPALDDEAIKQMSTKAGQAIAANLEQIPLPRDGSQRIAAAARQQTGGPKLVSENADSIEGGQSTPNAPGRTAAGNGRT